MATEDMLSLQTQDSRKEFSAVERRRFGFGHTRLVDGTSGGLRSYTRLD